MNVELRTAQEHTHFLKRATVPAVALFALPSLFHLSLRPSPSIYSVMLCSLCSSQNYLTCECKSLFLSAAKSGERIGGAV